MPPQRRETNVSQIEMLSTSAEPTDVSYHPALNDALRDLRLTNGRSLTDGEGRGNDSKASLLMAFVIIDTVSGKSEKSSTTQRANWYRVLGQYGYSEDESAYLLATSHSLTHGYGTPKPIANRRVVFTNDADARAVDLSNASFASISIPAVNRLVEAIAAQHYSEWDVSLLDPDIHLK